MSWITYGGVKMSLEAALALEQLDSPTEYAANDLRRLRSGEVTELDLLAECLDGADDDRVKGWHEYVDAVAFAAETIGR